MSARDEHSGGAKLFELAEKAVKLSALLGVFGYMSLRSHLNFIGISSTSSLGVERYLMETYNLALTTSVNVGIIVALTVLALLPLYLLGRGLLRLQMIGHRARLAWGWLRERQGGPLLPVGLFLCAVLYYIWLLVTLSHYGAHVDVAVGELKVEQLGTESSDSSWIYYRTFIACLLGYLVYSAIAPAAREPTPPAGAAHAQTLPPGAARPFTRYVWIAFLIVVFMLAIQLPLLYGRLVRTPVYPLMQVTTADRDAAPICGLLVLEGAAGMSLWRAENGVGRIVVLPHASARGVVTGQTLNLLTLAREAAADRSRVRPDCNDPRKPE